MTHIIIMVGISMRNMVNEVVGRTFLSDPLNRQEYLFNRVKVCCWEVRHSCLTLKREQTRMSVLPRKYDLRTNFGK